MKSSVYRGLDSGEYKHLTRLTLRQPRHANVTQRSNRESHAGSLPPDIHLELPTRLISVTETQTRILYPPKYESSKRYQRCPRNRQQRRTVGPRRQQSHGKIVLEPTKRAKPPHPLRLTFILVGLAALGYLASLSPFLAGPALFFVLLPSVGVFFIVRALLRWKFPEKFEPRAD